MGEQSDYLVNKQIERHMSVDGLIDDYTLFEYENRKTTHVWITANGDVLYYHQLTESHARNILRQVEGRGGIPDPELLKRIKYFDGQVLF